VSRRELVARAVGVGVAAAGMAFGLWMIRWPAPAVSVACGYGAYRLARGRRR
jgi:hypothetical protein